MIDSWIVIARSGWLAPASLMALRKTCRGLCDVLGIQSSSERRSGVDNNVSNFWVPYAVERHGASAKTCALYLSKECPHHAHESMLVRVLCAAESDLVEERDKRCPLCGGDIPEYRCDVLRFWGSMEVPEARLLPSSCRSCPWGAVWSVRVKRMAIESVVGYVMRSKAVDFANYVPGIEPQGGDGDDDEDSILGTLRRVLGLAWEECSLGEGTTSVAHITDCRRHVGASVARTLGLVRMGGGDAEEVIRGWWRDRVESSDGVLMNLYRDFYAAEEALDGALAAVTRETDEWCCGVLVEWRWASASAVDAVGTRAYAGAGAIGGVNADGGGGEVVMRNEEGRPVVVKISDLLSAGLLDTYKKLHKFYCED